MNAREFFDKVVEMREAQKKYFRMRTSAELTHSKNLEKEIDAEIARVQEMMKPKQPTQADLFPPNDEQK
jgi:tripartite-type tricarboxylate transporter receptor subunit TctC